MPDLHDGAHAGRAFGPDSPAALLPPGLHDVLAFDEFDRALVEQVHPPAWVNPTPAAKYHLVVVGAGTGGLVTAAIAASLGARVALVERHLMGGDCLNVGCVPSKAVIRAGRAWHAATGAAREFGAPEADGGGDFGLAMRRMRRLRARIAPVDGAPRFRSLGVDVFLGRGRFAAPDALEVRGDDGRPALLRFRRAVVATGARAAAPPIPGLAETGYRTNETIFALTERPARLLVVGGGPIGCELAQAFARLGTRVTLVNASSRVLGKEDPEGAAIVEAALRRDGVEIVHEAKVAGARRLGAARVLTLDRGGRREEVEGDELLVAVGRAANVEGLGLEEAGVAFDRRGVSVDDRLRTSNPRVFAVGDVAARWQFTHAADAQARIVVANALFWGRGRASRLVMPWCTYTSPELARVGLIESEARAAGHEVDTITVPLHDVDRAVLDGEEEGFLRVHLRRGSDHILGGTLVAAHAGDMIGELTLAMTAGLGLSKLSATIHPYPTQAEVFRKAADQWRRRKLTPAARRLLAAFFRLVR